MTSANMTYYMVLTLDGRKVAEYSEHCMCKSTIREDLAKHQPPSDFKLVLRQPDEEEADHYSHEMSLADYLDGKEVLWCDDDQYREIEVLEKKLSDSNSDFDYAVSVLKKACARCANPITEHGYGTTRPWSRLADDLFIELRDALKELEDRKNERN